MLHDYLHARNRLRQGESRYEDARIERCIVFVAEVEVEYELPGIWEY